MRQRRSLMQPQIATIKSKREWLVLDLRNILI